MIRKEELSAIKPRYLWDARLSLAEVGLLSKLLSMPDDQCISFRDLKRCCKEDYKTIRHTTHKLIEHGYVIRRQARGDFRKYGAWEYNVYDFPRFGTKNKTQKRRIMLQRRMIYSLFC